MEYRRGGCGAQPIGSTARLIAAMVDVEEEKVELPPPPASGREDEDTSVPWWERLSAGTVPTVTGFATVALMFLGILLLARNPTAALLVALPAFALGVGAMVLTITSRRQPLRLLAGMTGMVLTLSSWLVVAFRGLWWLALVQWGGFMIVALIGAYTLDQERKADVARQVRDTDTME